MQRYVSKELTHFVGKGLSEEEQYITLIKILNEGWLTSPPHNPLVGGNLMRSSAFPISSNRKYRPQCLCFCDIPVNDLNIHIKKYSPFGLSFLKSFLVAQGANPVFYIASNSSAQKILTDISKIREKNLDTVKDFKTFGPGIFYDKTTRSQYFDDMIDEYHKLFDTIFKIISQEREIPSVSEDMKRFLNLRRFLEFHIFAFLKFFDSNKSDEDIENFYMEREWRLIDNLKFNLNDVYRIILPEKYAERFREDMPKYRGQITFP